MSTGINPKESLTPGTGRKLKAIEGLFYQFPQKCYEVEAITPTLQK